jgi:DtxR family Mn-dependent transcriptional regulator
MSTISTENYLKALYHLQSQGDRVSTGALAQAIDVTQPSATKALKALANSGFVEHERYRGARLTAAGEATALRVIRKHRLVEVFLVRVLGYDWDEVHDEAEQLEHAISDRLADRIDAHLGFPEFDPHGDPIPGPDGTMPDHSWVSLDQIEAGTQVTVERVLSQDTDVLRYLDTLGVRPRNYVTILEQVPFDGPVRLSARGTDTTISRAMAKSVLVRPSANTSIVPPASR